MELDELKSSWNALEPPPPGTETELSLLLRNAEAAAGEPVRAMKRNVLRHSITLVIVYVVSFTQIQPVFRLPVGVLYSLTLLVFLIYYWKKYSLLKHMETAPRDKDMVTCLSNQLIRLKNLLRFYARSRYFMIPVAVVFLLACLWYYSRPYFYAFPGHTFLPGQEIGVLASWLGVTILLTVPSIFLSSWFMHLRYGQYIQQMEQDLQELQGNDLKN
jgi:hypothetical protein